jgi:septal ring factor EnvC (AmiA/AmiB activator)
MESMDTTRVFDTLDKKIERLLGRLKSLESDNEKLRADLATARRAEKEAGDSRGAVEKLEREQDLVRERLEKLIHALEAAEEKKS